MSEPAIPVSAIISIVAIGLAIIRELVHRKKDFKRLICKCDEIDTKKIEFTDLFDS